MKTIIIYSSNTGFTERYAKWIAEETDAELLTIKEAKKKDDSYFNSADAIVYGGWAMAGKIVNSEWFKSKMPNWKNKKLALFCVGASPMELPEVKEALHNALTDEERQYAKAFYCQGGLSYERMKLPSRLMMKAFCSMLKKQKDASEKDRAMAEHLSHSYDISDRKFIEPIVEYIK